MVCGSVVYDMGVFGVLVCVMWCCGGSMVCEGL